MNNGQMMRHFGVGLLGDAKNEHWVRLSFDTVRDMVAKAWDEGYGDDIEAHTPRNNPYRKESN